MRAKLKGLISPDIRNLEDWEPDDPNCFGLAIEAEIGPTDQDGAELFQMQVCTPSWFARRLVERPVMSGEHTLFMARYDFKALVAFIEDRCRRCEGTDWTDVVSQLRQLGYWEFEGYRPSGRG